jgi:cold shock CspA family protein
VTIRAQARRADIVAGGDDIETRLALRNALTTFTRELKRLRDRRAPGPPEPVSGPPLRGVIDRVFREDGYGFLVGDDGEQVYFHRNTLSGGLELQSIHEGQGVAFNIEPGEKGSQATVVVPPPPELI